LSQTLKIGSKLKHLSACLRPAGYIFPFTAWIIFRFSRPSYNAGSNWPGLCPPRRIFVDGAANPDQYNQLRRYELGFDLTLINLLDSECAILACRFNTTYISFPCFKRRFCNSWHRVVMWDIIWVDDKGKSKSGVDWDIDCEPWSTGIIFYFRWGWWDPVLDMRVRYGTESKTVIRSNMDLKTYGSV